MKPVVIIGGGGHARVVEDALRVCGRELIGVTDNSPNDIHMLGVKVLGTDEVVFGMDPEKVELANGIGGIGDTSPRRRVFDKFKAFGFSFATIVHPSTVVATNVILGEGCQVMAGVVLQPGVTIGVNTIVNTVASIDHDSHIGAHCHVAPGAIICGKVIVGTGSHIGAGAVLIQGTRIEEGVLVQAAKSTRKVSLY